MNAAYRYVIPFALIVAASGCASIANDNYIKAVERQTPEQAATVYVYPLKGQDKEQQARDRYECHLWAVSQSGFDPSADSSQRAFALGATPPPDGRDALVLGSVGAVLGATVAGPRHAGEGAVVGAVTGVAAGAASEAAKSARREQQAAAAYGALEQKALSYRRAISACLEGRQYTVH